MATNQPASLTSLDEVIKRLYSDKRPHDLTYTRHPFLGWVPKQSGFTGKSLDIPVGIANIAGGSAVFSDAVSNRQSSQFEAWRLTRVSSYQTATLENELIGAMSNDKGAFLRAVTTEIDSAYRAFARDLAWSLYQDGTGVRGTISTVADTVVTFDTALEARAFEIGMRCTVYDSSDSGLAGTPNATNIRVTAVDPANKTVTFDTDLDTVAGTVVAACANGDFIVRAGDENAKVTGLDGWLTGTTSLFGVTRSTAPALLSGLAYDADTPNLAHDVALRKAGAVAMENEGMPSTVFMNPIDVGILNVDIDSAGVQYDKVKSTVADIGYDSIKVHCGGFVADVVADAWCPIQTAYMIDKTGLCLHSLDGVPSEFSKDGNVLHRLEGSDAVEFRLTSYLQLGVACPGKSVVITLDT